MITRIDAGSPAVRESIVTCRLGDEQYALRGTDAWEVVRAERMRRVAGGDGVIGTIEVSGEAVPVYSLAAALHRPAPLVSSRRLLGEHVVVTRSAAGLAGWLVDRIARSSLDGAPLVHAVPRVLGPLVSRWFEGFLVLDDDMRPLLSPAGLDPRNSWNAEPEPAGEASPAAAPFPDRRSQERGAPLVILFVTNAFPACEAGRYALSARRVVAVIQAKGITVVPGSAPFITGVMRWRETIVPVIDVREAGSTSATERHLVARSGPGPGDLVAFPVIPPVTLHQATNADVAIAERSRERPPFVGGVYAINGQTVALLDVIQLLAVLAAVGADASCAQAV